MTPVNAADAGKAFKLDLAEIGLRLEAGEHRDRGGHDLRNWYETRAIEEGADSLILRRTTHAAPKDVAGGLRAVLVGDDLSRGREAQDRAPRRRDPHAWYSRAKGEQLLAKSGDPNGT